MSWDAYVETQLAPGCGQACLLGLDGTLWAGTPDFMVRMGWGVIILRIYFYLASFWLFIIFFLSLLISWSLPHSQSACLRARLLPPIPFFTPLLYSSPPYDLHSSHISINKYIIPSPIATWIQCQGYARRRNGGGNCYQWSYWSRRMCRQPDAPETQAWVPY